MIWAKSAEAGITQHRNKRISVQGIWRVIGESAGTRKVREVRGRRMFICLGEAATESSRTAVLTASGGVHTAKFRHAGNMQALRAHPHAREPGTSSPCRYRGGHGLSSARAGSAY